MRTRRDFIRQMAGITAGIMLPAHLEGSRHTSSSDKLGELLPLRKLGSTGENVTMLGVGGYHVGWTSERNAREVIETALEGGIRFFDTAHNYGDGTSEERYGKYLVPRYRDQVFLMTKSRAQDGRSLLEEVDLSLRRLKTDRVDLLQLHALRTPEDVDRRANQGVLEAVLKVRDQGKARFVGFTGHQDPYAHLRMLERISGSAEFSTIQMPANIIDLTSAHSFIRHTLPVALERNLGVLAMKTLADGRFFGKKVTNGRVRWETQDPAIPDHLGIKDALHFSWSLPVSVLITGAENKDLLTEKISLARSFVSLSANEREQLLKKAYGVPDRDQVEYYKNVEK